MARRVYEHGVVRKKCRGCLRVALLYPSLYQAAVASLAYQLIYYLLNSLDFVVAERFTLPSLGEVEAPLSLETGAPLNAFHAVIIPVSYELDIVYALAALRASGIDPRRGEGPLVVFGGPVPSMNPAPLRRVSDVVVVGEAEPTLPLLAEKLYENLDDPRRALDELDARNGFLVRGVEARAKRVYTPSLDDAFHPILEFRVPGSGEPWGEAYMVEVSRGCRWMCRFCMEAFFTLPWRTRSFGKITRLVEEGVTVNQVSRVAFYSLSFFDHPAADRLLEFVVEERLTATIGSLRADTLNEHRLELLRRVGQRTVTIAPETFREKLGCLLNKRIQPEAIEALVKAATRLGLKPKLYLMTGLPGETLRDAEADAELAARLYRLSRGTMRATLNPLVPKPWTPLQWAPFIDEKGYEARLRVYRRRLGGNVEPLSYRWAYAQAVLARGGEDLGPLLYEEVGVAPRLGRLLRVLRGTRWARLVERGWRVGEDEMPWVEMVDPGYPLKSLERSYEAALACLS